MGALEIVLLIVGAIVFILSFVLPVKSESKNGEPDKVARKEIKELVSEEIAGMKAHVNDMVEETVTYAMEKTERSLERLSNEKIMAVNEYSDTVLQEINRNHNEVMFLYEMLNDKQKYLKNTVKEVNQAVKEVNQTVKEAGQTAKEVAETKKEAEEIVNSFQKLTPEAVTVPEIQPDVETVKDTEEITGDVERHETEAAKEPVLNSNERILELHAAGMDKVDIARELGLGVGEVKLVIDLFKNI